MEISWISTNKIKLFEMNLSEFKYKAQRKLYGYYYNRIHKEPFLKYCSHYTSYRHSLKQNGDGSCINYIAARPNPGAGIGHQMANWMAGYHLAKVLGLKFANIPFSRYHHPWVSTPWNDFLGFGENEASYKDLLQNGYKKVLLPQFNEMDEEQFDVIKKIIASYSDQKVVFLCEQDQFYRDLNTLIPDLQQKFYSASARENDKLVYDSSNFNIAIHVRRGDIMDDPTNPNLAMRYLSNDYFEKVLDQVFEKVKTITDKPVHIYFFSQGKAEDYPEFAKYPNFHWCMDMGAMASFLHMVYADLLITSKSSFSYKPALLNRGIKVCPENFWHGYPDSKDWIMVDNEGNVKWK